MSAQFFNSVTFRYGVAILATASFMIFQSLDVVRAGASFGAYALFWAVSVTLGWLEMILISRGVRATFDVERYPGWTLLLISAVLGAVPLTFQVRWMMETIINPEMALRPFWGSYLNVLVINTVFCGVQYLFVERWPLFPRAAADAEPDQPQSPGPGPIEAEAQNTGRAGSRAVAETPMVHMLRRPPPGLVGEIRYLQMEDHYLRVHTVSGNDLTLYRMSDAVLDLAGADGMQVHKSWWVSRAAVERVETENRRRSIITTCGATIPVGRSFEKALRDAGWI